MDGFGGEGGGEEVVFFACVGVSRRNRTSYAERNRRRWGCSRRTVSSRRSRSEMATLCPPCTAPISNQSSIMTTITTGLLWTNYSYPDKSSFDWHHDDSIWFGNESINDNLLGIWVCWNRRCRREARGGGTRASTMFREVLTWRWPPSHSMWEASPSPPPPPPLPPPPPPPLLPPSTIGSDAKVQS